jgi:hypothetical protein
MPGIGELIEGAMQQAAQWSRQFMVGRIVGPGMDCGRDLSTGRP